MNYVISYGISVETLLFSGNKWKEGLKYTVITFPDRYPIDVMIPIHGWIRHWLKAIKAYDHDTCPYSILCYYRQNLLLDWSDSLGLEQGIIDYICQTIPALHMLKSQNLASNLLSSAWRLQDLLLSKLSEHAFKRSDAYKWDGVAYGHHGDSGDRTIRTASGWRLWRAMMDDTDITMPLPTADTRQIMLSRWHYSTEIKIHCWRLTPDRWPYVILHQTSRSANLKKWIQFLPILDHMTGFNDPKLYLGASKIARVLLGI